MLRSAYAGWMLQQMTWLPHHTLLMTGARLRHFNTIYTSHSRWRFPISRVMDTLHEHRQVVRAIHVVSLANHL